LAKKYNTKLLIINNLDNIIAFWVKFIYSQNDKYVFVIPLEK